METQLEARVERELGEISVNQRVIMNNMDKYFEALTSHTKDDKQAFDKIHSRLQSIESKINYAAGSIGIVASGIAVFWSAILSFIRGN